jgi:hypothetical protein
MVSMDTETVHRLRTPGQPLGSQTPSKARMRTMKSASPKSVYLPVLQCLAIVVLMMSVVQTATAQRTQSTASKAVQLQAFGMFSYVRPAFIHDNRPNWGGAAGADVNFHQIGYTRLRPGVEMRATGSGGPTSNQYTYGGGPRLVMDLGRFQPYGDFLFNYGSIDFNHPPDPNYTYDATDVLSYGGGVDFVLDHSWAVRADVQSQQWKLGHISPEFQPLAVSVGVRYEFHFRNKYSPE